METLNDFVKCKFGIDEKTFLEILKISPGAEGYLLGALGEQLFKQYAESKGFEVLRIKEKPNGGYDAKSDDVRGDFYIRKKDRKYSACMILALLPSFILLRGISKSYDNQLFRLPFFNHITKTKHFYL